MKTKELVYLLNKEAEKSKNRDKKAAPYIGRAYSNVIKKINDNYLSSEVITQSKIDVLPLTSYMKTKISALLKINIKQNDKVQTDILQSELRNITGIGPKKANDLIKSGLRTLDDIKKTKWRAHLNLDTLTALDTMPNKALKHQDIKKIEPKLIGFGKNVQIVGSYRRKKPVSKDIDIMICSASLGIMAKYLDYLKKTFNQVWIYSKGPDKLSAIIAEGPKRFKIDVFRTHPENYWAQLLYSTGSKENNLRMRAKAKKLGLLLNQKGLWRGSERVLGPRANEQMYYKYLDIPYLEPHQR